MPPVNSDPYFDFSSRAVRASAACRVISEDGRLTEPRNARMHRSWALARQTCGTLLVLAILFSEWRPLRIQMFGRF
jgi:hypothetical protein